MSLSNKDIGFKRTFEPIFCSRERCEFVAGVRGDLLEIRNVRDGDRTFCSGRCRRDYGLTQLVRLSEEMGGYGELDGPGLPMGPDRKGPSRKNEY